MIPQLLLVAIAALLVGVWFVRRRAHVQAVAARFVLELLDAAIFGYAAYVAFCLLLEWSSFQTMEGLANNLFFTDTLSTWQTVALVVGAFVAYQRFHQAANTEALKKMEQSRGRRIMSFREALAWTNSILAARAEKARLKRPQHLKPDASYDPPDEMVDPDNPVFDATTPLSDIDTNGALTPYEVQPGEYDTVLWGMIRIPEVESKKHFAVIGATGSGKTLMFRALMKTVLPRVKTHSNFRAFIYDNKPDFLPFARMHSMESLVWNFDPFDASGVAWDIADDVTTPALAKQVAEVLAPVDPLQNQKYFDEASQLLLEAVMVTFMEISGKNWTLRDVLLVCTSESRIKKLTALSSDYSVKSAIATVFAPDKSPDEVIASMMVRLGPYNVAAALWSHAPPDRKRSVKNWRDQNAVLLITGRSDCEKAQRPINRALFRLASLLLLSQPDSDETASWFFLDEIREIGKLEGLRSLANKGRSKGVRLVLGFQTIEGMRAEHDENSADEIVNLCANKTFLHSNSEKTRRWMAESVGEKELNERIFTNLRGVEPGGTSPSLSGKAEPQVRPAMRQEDFEENLKPVSDEYGFTALNTIPIVGTYLSWVPKSLIDGQLPEPAKAPDVLRPPEHQRLLDWNAGDLKRLSLPADFLADESKSSASPKPSSARRESEASGTAPVKRQRAQANDGKDKQDAKHKRLWDTR